MERSETLILGILGNLDILGISVLTNKLHALPEDEVAYPYRVKGI